MVHQLWGAFPLSGMHLVGTKLKLEVLFLWKLEERFIMTIAQEM